MHRALREMRIRGVKTNIPFLRTPSTTRTSWLAWATTRMIDVTPGLFKFKARRDRASRLLSYLAEIIVNGNPQVKGRARMENPLPLIEPSFDTTEDPPRGTRDLLLAQGPKKFSKWLREQKPLMVTDTTLRDAHQSLFAARMRSYDMLAVADYMARRASGLFSLEMWGGATFDTCIASSGSHPTTAFVSSGKKYRTFFSRCSRADRMRSDTPTIRTTWFGNSWFMLPRPEWAPSGFSTP